jgi:hypothetical protein
MTGHGYAQILHDRPEQRSVGPSPALYPDPQAGRRARQLCSEAWVKLAMVL